MAIGPHQPQEARNRCWKDCLGIVLNETTTALEESFCDLTDAQVWGRPVPQRHSIGTMVMHCLESLNGFACWVQTGRGAPVPADEAQFDMWSCTPEQLDQRQKGADLPATAQMAQWLRQVRELATQGLDSATEEDLRGPRANSDWCRRTHRPAGDAYMRCLAHVAAHVRQIWCLRGAMGAFNESAWPQQHYA